MKGIFLAVSFLVTIVSQAQIFFVAAAGNDNNQGTKIRPFKTLAKAISVAKALNDKKINIQLREGIYYLDTTLIISSGDNLSALLTIENYPGEEAVISAGQSLQLQWELFRDGIYKTTIPQGLSFERLYINDQLQHMARYPNYDSSARIYHGTAADALSPERIKKWKNPKGGYVHGIHGYEWGSQDYLITDIENGKINAIGGYQNNRPMTIHNTYRFVENIFEELDYPGEWYCNRGSNILYYYPPANLDLKKASVVVSKLKNTIELKGTSTNPVRNVSIKGLTFRHNERSFMETKEPLLRSDWTIYRGGAILFDGTSNCNVKDCNFFGNGGNAIMLSNYNVKDTITGCHIANIGASAVCFIGNPDAVRSPLFNYTQSLSYDKLDKTTGPLTSDYPQQCVVTDNLLHHVGEIEKQATGVEISMASEITVTHNSIYNTPRAGINIGDGTWGGHTIAFNDVFNTVQETGDHGAFNSWGRDRYWHPDRNYMDSLVKVHPEIILLDAIKQTVIHDNRFRCDLGWDIDLDDGSSHYLIYNNVCLNGGLKLREGFYRTVKNNIMVNNSFHPHVWFANSGDEFMNNIITTKYEPIGINDWGKSVNHNFFLSAGGLEKAKASGTDVNSIAGDALFINAAKGNYTVAANSAALKTGFRNFSMNQFGVKKLSLKKIALQPKISPLIIDIEVPEGAESMHFLGATIKKVNGMGDRSAYGLPDANGVIILSLDKKSLLLKAGVKENDVIRMVDRRFISSMQDWITVYQSLRGKSIMAVELIRNQQLMKINIQID